ncbi:MAG: hypothetical protein K6E51_02055 [Treponema sp.]|nr:hypothetical protein [Treponema sp.]
MPLAEPNLRFKTLVLLTAQWTGEKGSKNEINKKFFVFSFVGLSLMLILFHAGLLALPVIAFMWTFWGFNVLTLNSAAFFSSSVNDSAW